MSVRIEPHQISICYERRVLQTASVSGEELFLDYGVESVDIDYLEFEDEDTEESECQIYVDGVILTSTWEQMRDRLHRQLNEKNELITSLENRLLACKAEYALLCKEKGDEK